MEQIMNYIKPELVVVAVVLYFVGMALKKAQAVADKNIPGSLVDAESLCVLSGSGRVARSEPVRKWQWRYSLRSFRVF